MDWIFDNPQILFVIAAAVAYWINSMRQAREEAAEDRRRDDTPVEVEDIFGPDFDFGESSRERADSAPPHTEVFLPPPITRAPPAAPPPLPGHAAATREPSPGRHFPSASPMPQRPISPHDSDALKSAHAHNDELERQRSLQERIQSLRQNRDQRSSGAAATERKAKAKRTAKAGDPIAEAADPTSLVGIRRRLQSPREARRAIVMREILDKPVGMRG